jgi:DNA replication protein
MKSYGGFPAKMLFTPVPEPFFSHVLPGMSDIAELKTTLTIVRLLYRKRGSLRFVTAGELIGDAALMNGLTVDGSDPQLRLAAALDQAVARGTVLRMTVAAEGTSSDAFFLNTESDRQVMAKLHSGELQVPGLKVVEVGAGSGEAMPDVFSLYEDNIGLLTPMISDELREAMKSYPEAWIRDAIREAARNNKRKWSYIAAIMERWNSEGKSDGKSDGTYRGYSKKADPDKYIKGKYGHMVQR